MCAARENIIAGEQTAEAELIDKLPRVLNVGMPLGPIGQSAAGVTVTTMYIVEATYIG